MSSYDWLKKCFYCRQQVMQCSTKMYIPNCMSKYKISSRLALSHFLSPPVQFAQWAHMQRFPSVCLYVWTGPKIRLDKKFISQKVLYLGVWNFTELIILAKWISIIGMTGRTHCQRQVAFFIFFLAGFATQVLQNGPNPRNGKKSDQAHPPIHPLKYTNTLQVCELRSRKKG